MYYRPEQYYLNLLGLVKKELDLYTRYAVRMRDDGGIRHIYNTKLFKEELSNILEDDFTGMNRNGYQVERNMLRQEWRQLHEEALQSMKAGVMLPFEYMLRIFGLTEFEQYCACLAFAPELNREYERMYCYIQDDYSFKFPTVDLCVKMYTMDIKEQNRLIHQFFMKKELLGCVFTAPPSGTESELSWKLKLRRAVTEYIFFYEADLSGRSSPYYIEVPEVRDSDWLNVNGSLQERIDVFLEKEADGRKKVLLLQGAEGIGKRTQVSLAAARRRRNVMYFDLREVAQKNAEQRKEELTNAAVRARLDHAFLCICHLEAFMTGDKWNHAMLRETLQAAGTMSEVLFCLSEEECRLSENTPRNFETEIFFLKMPTIQQRLLLWKEFLGERTPENNVQMETLAAQFEFTPGMIESVVTRVEGTACLQPGEPAEIQALYEECQQKVSHRLGERASRVNAAYTWDDLILDPDQKEMLRQACCQIEYRYRVYEEWGFCRKVAYGRGVSMLFAGPPGTGKTMAAQVLAKELNLEIYKVDLSGVLSKYIGETQKNLREIFDEVRKSRSILFFDEADALFGKRVNVSDARDISANAQTAYLLQKMEEYDGITILATNLMQNFDDAYKRRMKYIIQFTLPKEVQRREMWEKVFPQQMPLDSDFDVDYLASNFELSGAGIKNIALNAAFMAASEQEITGMKHIVTALQQEYQKSGKTLGKEELKEYYIYKK